MNMPQILGVIALSAAVASPLAAQGSKSASSDKNASEKAMIANEQKINDAVAKGDLNAFKSLVHKDALQVDGNGLMSVSEFEKNFKQVKIDPGWKITETKVIWIASNTAVLAYKWTGKGTFMGQPVPPVVFASTVWHKDGDKWFAMFHQESAAAPGK
jgi:hypothetical protein